MKEIILALLTAKFGGVRKDVLNGLARAMALQAKTNEEAKTLVDNLTDAQVNDYAKETRADVDKEVSESNKTFEANLRKKFEFKEKGKTDPEPGGGKNDPKPDPNDIATLVANAVAQAVKPLQDKIAGYETDNVAKSRLQQLNEKLSSCKDESFKAQTLKDFKRMNFDSDDDFAEYLKGKADDIETANQNVADSTLGKGGGSPLFSQKEESGISKGVAEFVESQKPANNQFAGKEV